MSKHPWKLYGVTYDGNKNEVGVFIDAFSTKEEAKHYSLHKEYHTRCIEFEKEDEKND